jgi:hypothetical protein
MYWRWSGAIFRPAVDAVGFWTAGPDGVREQDPVLLFRLYVFDIRWVVPVPGLTGLALTSRHSRNHVSRRRMKGCALGSTRGG